MRAWDDLTPDQTIRPNGTLVDLTPATYVWLNPALWPRLRGHLRRAALR